MRRRVAALMVTAALLSQAIPATAETSSPTPPASPIPSPSASGDPFVVPFDGEARALIFPEATFDGSVTESGTVITLKADVFFAYNKAELHAKAAEALDRAAASLTEQQARTVRVAGFTDKKGTASYNQGLSLRRAEAVRAALVKRVPGLAVEVKGYGESRPVATNETARGRALNRRVTITVTG